MDPQGTFFAQSVDRTPYRACAIVALAACCFFILGFLGLWRLGTLARHHHWVLGGHTAGNATPKITFPGDTLQRAQDAAKSAAAHEKASLQSAAEQAAQQAADAVIQEQKDAAKKQLQSLLSTPTPSPTATPPH
jgi:hypothetical protein